MNTTLAFFVRASDQRLVIKSTHAQLHATGARTGSRQTTVSEVAPVQSAIPPDVYEWALPAIEDAATSTNVSGTSTIAIAGSYMPMQSAAASATANCNWQFTKGPQVPGGSISSAGSPGNLHTPTAVSTLTPLTPIAGAQPLAVSSINQPSSSVAGSVNSGTTTRTPVATASLDPPTGFTAQPLDQGAVKFSWQPVKNAQQYRIDGTGIPSTGAYSKAGPANATGPLSMTAQNIPPGPGTWKLVAVYGNNSFNPKQAATAQAMVRYVPPHVGQFLNKTNGLGSLADTQRHYLSIPGCSKCLTGTNMASIMANIGVYYGGGIELCIEPFGQWEPDCQWPEGVYSNATEFGTDRAARCIPMDSQGTRGDFYRIPGQYFCYSKSANHGLTAILVKNGSFWFMTFATPPDPTKIWDYTLTLDVTFDSEGSKHAPHACLACHGGKFDPKTAQVTGATLLPLDPSLLQISDRSDINANRIFDINKTVMWANPSPAVAHYLTELYGTDIRTVNWSPSIGWGQPTFVPRDWSAQRGLYLQVVKPHCTMCHLATPSNLDFSSWDNFQQNSGPIHTDVCGHAMPHAEYPYKQLWTQDTGPFFMPSLLLQSLGYQACP